MSGYPSRAALSGLTAARLTRDPSTHGLAQHRDRDRRAIVALIGAVLAALCIRQGWDEGSRVEVPGGETIFDPTPPREQPFPPPPRDR